MENTSFDEVCLCFSTILQQERDDVGIQSQTFMGFVVCFVVCN